MNSSFWPKPANPASFAMPMSSICPFPAKISITIAISSRSSPPGPSLMRRPETFTTRRGSSARRRPKSASASAGIEVGQVFYFGDKYSKPMQAVVTGPDGIERPISGRLLRRRRLAPRRRPDRGQPRRSRHHLAGSRGAVSTSGIANLKVGDAKTDAACDRTSTQALEKAGVDVLYDDRTRGPARNSPRWISSACRIRSSSARRAWPRARSR